MREIRRTRQLRTSQARLQFVSRRAARRIKICESLNGINEDLAFGSNEVGRLAAVIGGAAALINFSVSHSDEYGLVAISDQRQLGVDLEIRNSYRNFSGISNWAFSTTERQALVSISTRPILKFHLPCSEAQSLSSFVSLIIRKSSGDLRTSAAVNLRRVLLGKQFRKCIPSFNQD